MMRLWQICRIDDPTAGSLLLAPDAAPIGDYPFGLPRRPYFQLVISLKNVEFQKPSDYKGLAELVATNFSTEPTVPAVLFEMARPPYPALVCARPFTFNKAMIIGPSENSPRSDRRVRSRKYPPGELIMFARSRMPATATAAFSGPMTSHAS